MKKVYICEFYQESNAFNPVLSGYDLYQWGDPVWQTDREPQYMGDEGLAISGMIDALQQEVQLIFGPGYSAPSGGPVEQKVVEDFSAALTKSLHDALPLDGVVISLHGATVSERSDDVCGDILEQIHSIVGQDVPISAAFDMHANITKKTTDHLTCFTGYQTYPHLDMYETGFRAARLLLKHLQQEPLFTACARLPMIAPANGYATNKGSFGRLTEELSALPITDWSIFMAQPWLDVEEICAAVIIAAHDRETAESYAAQMAEKLWTMREELLGEPLRDIASVVRAAAENESDKPIVLADSADSPNAGATGDCAAVLAYMLPYRDSLRCAVSVNDADAVEQAFRLGVGAKADFVLGAKMAPRLSEPILVKDAVVRSLHSGAFLLGGPAERGSRQELGRCAVLDAGQIQILVTTSATRNGDLQFYRAFGIEPTLCRLVSVKACTSFRAGYAPIAAEIIPTSTPGASASDLKQLPYRKLPTPLFPFQNEF